VSELLTIVRDNSDVYAKAIGTTLLASGLAIVFALILGLILAVMRDSRVAVFSGFARLYVSFFRGTPLLLQILILYNGLVTLQLTGFQALAFGLSLHFSAYISESFRAAISSVDRGQWEAADALGISYFKQLRSIILPQAFKNILPAIMNELITLTKESALVSTVGVLDVMRRAQIVGGEKAIYFEPLLFAGFVYFVLVMGLSLIGQQVEKAMRKSG